MTLTELEEQFDNKMALVMAEFLKGNIAFEEYDIEMTRLGEWFDEVKKEIEEKSS